MGGVRPTLRVIRQLPRDTFTDPATFDLVARLRGASKGDRERMFGDIRLYDLHHPLLEDYHRHVDRGTLPDRHKASTTARSSVGHTGRVYEVRSRTGAAWRGAVIIDQDGQPWLVFADRHDRFHASAAAFFKQDPANYLPTKVDRLLRDAEDQLLQEREHEVSCLRQLVHALAECAADGGGERTMTVTGFDRDAGTCAVRVELGEPASSVATAHETLGIVSVFLRIPAQASKLRDLLIRLYVLFIQPDVDMREEVVTSDYESLEIELLVPHASLARLLVTTASANSDPAPADAPDPSVQHYVGSVAMTRAFVEGTAIKARCGTWYVPQRAGDRSAHLPICATCEEREPVAQTLIDNLRAMSEGQS